MDLRGDATLHGRLAKCLLDALSRLLAGSSRSWVSATRDLHPQHGARDFTQGVGLQGSRSSGGRIVVLQVEAASGQAPDSEQDSMGTHRASKGDDVSLKGLIYGCPFCGEIPEFHNWHGGRQKTMIACHNGQCPVQPDAVASTRQRAIQKWNTRKQPLMTSAALVPWTEP